jgi:hypothetical protein
LFDGGDHVLKANAAQVDSLITRFILRCAGVEVTDGVRAKAEAQLLPTAKEEKVELMKKGGDLGGSESVD